MKQTTIIILAIIATVGGSLIVRPANATVARRVNPPEPHPLLEVTCLGTNIGTAIKNTIDACDNSGNFWIGLTGVVTGIGSLYYSTVENAMHPSVLAVTGMVSMVHGVMGVASSIKSREPKDVVGEQKVIIGPVAKYSIVTTTIGIEVKITF